MLLSNAMQTMRHWSGKFAAARAGNVDASPPLVLYRPGVPQPPQPPKPAQKVRRTSWKRSHVLRVSMQMRRRRERWQRSGPNGKKALRISLTIVAVVLVALVSSGVASGYAYYQSQYPLVQGVANNQIEQSTHIYDRNGNLIYTAYDGKYGRSTPITYNEVPGVMQDAMIAAEDHTFWDNVGVDPQGILRAASEYASSGSVQSGGSTITQQVIKNLTHDTQVTIQRKLSEGTLAIGLTQQYPKWKILEMYFNVSPFGAQELGVEAAVEDYFGLHAQCDANFKCIPGIAFLDRDLTKCKNPKDLNTCQSNPLLELARASLLAGMPQNPPGYDPTVNQSTKAAALARQDYVLNEMMGLNMGINLGLGDQTKDSGLGPITTDVIQKVEALTQKMNFVGFKYTKNDPHFVDWIIPQIENALGNGDPQLGAHLFLTGGFNIRTTIDSNLENFIENDVRHHLDDPEYQIFLGDYGPLNTVHNVNDSAVVVEEAKTGEILAMDGSADYNNNSDPRVAGQVNVATSLRSPGSAFKPIVYATAFQMGWYPGIVLPDKETYFYTGSQSQDVNAVVNGVDATYHPYDYGQTWHNLNSNIVLDIANSFNVPAVKTLEFAGTENVLQMARRFGITDIDQDAVNYSNAYDAQYHSKKRFTAEQILGPSFALGAYDVSLLQMVSAYQVFADQGKRIPPQYVLDIWDNYGHHIYQYNPSNPPAVQVISPQIAYLMSSILTNNAARALEFAPDMVLTTSDWDNRPVAAKTGTSEGFQDNLTLGYTPDIVVGTWSGNANGDLMKHTVGISGAAPIWHDALEYASGKCFTKGIFPGGWTSCNDMSFPADGFTQPAGVLQQYVNTVNGLMGNGYDTYMLTGDVPVQTGFTSTNGTTTPTGSPTASPTP
ncbi:MAG TPA: transglycosylase domain-containing protein [Ktedonobacteraceae bacterium]|nr:transglycosylase domain-containing protein [Ktedonobacteraceae bacterium]